MQVPQPEQAHSDDVIGTQKTTLNRNSLWTAAFLVILLAGIVFRLLYILQPVGNDEAYTFLGFAIKPLLTILTDYSHPNNHIFHTLLVAGFTRIFGNAIWIMRMPAFLAGIAEIWLIYLVGRKMFHPAAGVISAAFMAASPIAINLSAEARGYTLVGSFSLLLLYLAIRLIEKPKPLFWAFLALVGALGMYAIPIMLYPIAAIYLWILLSTLVTHRFSAQTGEMVKWMIFSGLGMIVITLILYSPVIIWGTGWQSIVSNGNILPEKWSIFITNLIARSRRTWEEWNDLVPLWISIIIVIGFLASFLPAKQKERQKTHLFLTFLPAIGIILMIQQVAPWPRVWHFAMCWYFLYSGIGWIKLLETIHLDRIKAAYLGLIGVLIFAPILVRGTMIANDRRGDLAREPGVEEVVAGILLDNLQPGEVVLSVTPISTQIKFYVYQTQPYDDLFYNTNIQQPFTSVLVVTSDKYDMTLNTVITKNKLLGKLDLETSQTIASYKHVSIYRINKQK